jgi:hypothetical protein
MPNVPHRIRRLRCSIATNSQTAAFAMRKSLHDRWQDTLMPAFESAFDEIASDDRVIHIPKLELHLKVTAEQDLLAVLPELIQQQLTEQLSSIDWDVIPTNSGMTWQTETAQQNQFATLLHYLQTGSLPWQSMQISPSEIAIKLQETCRDERSQLVSYLSIQVRTVAVYFRLFQLLSDSEILAFVNTLSDGFLPEWRTAIMEFLKFVIDPAQSLLNRQIQCQLVATILSECLNRSIQAIEPDFRRIVDSLGINFDEIVPFLPVSVSQRLKSPLVIQSPPTRTKIGENISLTEPDDELSESDEFPIGVNYAGLILIHPFIGAFFEATGITDSNNSIDPTQLVRAATLLHFLATGREEVYEYELGLIKILLGLELETPLLVGAELITEQDRSEAEVVLQSILNYWTVLKNTSVGGLRSSFLQRSGLLRKIEQGWSLQVEHQSFDMLLEHLPWSISIIKLAWMKYPLYIEWQTF